MNEVLKVLKERRSIRKYKAEQIRDEELNAILGATSRNILLFGILLSIGLLL